MHTYIHIKHSTHWQRTVFESDGNYAVDYGGAANAEGVPSLSLLRLLSLLCSTCVLPERFGSHYIATTACLVGKRNRAWHVS